MFWWYLYSKFWHDSNGDTYFKVLLVGEYFEEMKTHWYNWYIDIVDIIEELKGIKAS